MSALFGGERGVRNSSAAAAAAAALRLFSLQMYTVCLHVGSIPYLDNVKPFLRHFVLRFPRSFTKNTFAAYVRHASHVLLSTPSSTFSVVLPMWWWNWCACPRRLVVKACALPDVRQAGVPCAYLVNPCNWRLVSDTVH